MRPGATREKARTVDGLDDIVEEFLVESHENLDQLDSDLVALEQDPNSRERLSSIFRTIHTIKGTSGFLAFNRLEEVTHVGENMLSRLRDGELELSPARTSVLLQMVDTVRSLLASIEASGGEGPVDVSAVVAAITAAMDDAPAPAPAPGPVPAEVPAPRASAETTPAEKAPAKKAPAKKAPPPPGGGAPPRPLRPAPPGKKRPGEKGPGEKSPRPPPPPPPRSRPGKTPPPQNPPGEKRPPPERPPPPKPAGGGNPPPRRTAG